MKSSAAHGSPEGQTVAADTAGIPELLSLTADGLPDSAGTLLRARSFAQPLIEHETLDTGENMLAHADAVAAILRTIGGSEAMQAACYLVYAWRAPESSLRR